jgi:glycosyltransferase involved in cell wall biosynthesis
MSKNTALFVSPLLAMPQQHGGCVYPNAVLSALHAQGVPLDYMWLAWPLSGKKAIMRDPLSASYVGNGHIPGTLRFGNWRVRNPRNWSFQRTATTGNDESPKAEDQQFFRRQIARRPVRNVLIDFATTLPVLDALSPSERAAIHVSVLTHNLNWRRTDLYRAHKQPLDFMPMTCVQETALLERADLIVAIQEGEAEVFRTMLPHKRVVTVPMPVKAEALPPGEGGTPVCLFVGGYSGHNLAGLEWLLREVWPAVLQRCPEARLHVAGTVSQAIPKDAIGVRSLGPVDSLRDAYAAATVALAPLPMGTGLKIKVIEAMGWGRPVVTTSAGAEGFPELERGECAVVADGPEAFVEAILRLLCSPTAWQEVVDRQLVWIEERLSPEAALRPLTEAWSYFPSSVSKDRTRVPAHIAAV